MMFAVPAPTPVATPVSRSPSRLPRCSRSTAVPVRMLFDASISVAVACVVAPARIDVEPSVTVTDASGPTVATVIVA